MKQNAFFERVKRSRLLTGFLLLGLLLSVVLFAGSTLAAPVSSPAFAPTIITTVIGTAIPVTPITPVPVSRPDLGDAPASLNNHGVSMTAYAGVTANFPTVFNAPGSTGYKGPKHFNDGLRYYLGANMSTEGEADMGFDQDGINNIVPPNNNPNNDQFDDGLTFGNFGHCQLKTVTFNVTVTSSNASSAYFNLYADWNRSGRWGDLLLCDTHIVPEWAVSNLVVNFSGPGTYTFTTPPFATYNTTPQKAMWLRATLSNSPAPDATGRGPDIGYRFGETEDYRIPGILVTAVPTFEATFEATIVPQD